MGMCNARVGRALVPVAALAMAMALSACAKRDSITVGAVPDDYRTNHPIVLSEKEQVLDIPVGMLSYRMTDPQRAAVEGFLENYVDSGQSVVMVMIPDGSPNAPAAGRVSQDMIAYIHRLGVPQGHVQLLAYQAPTAQTAPIRLSYSLLKATVGQCGRWPEDLLDTTENKHYANFGCSYQNNLAAQMANPMDLLGPRKTTTIDAENRDAAIGDYKARKISESFEEKSEVFY